MTVALNVAWAVGAAGKRDDVVDRGAESVNAAVGEPRVSRQQPHSAELARPVVAVENLLAADGGVRGVAPPTSTTNGIAAADSSALLFSPLFCSVLRSPPAKFAPPGKRNGKFRRAAINANSILARTARQALLEPRSIFPVPQRGAAFAALVDMRKVVIAPGEKPCGELVRNSRAFAVVV